jgi:hypothetical protein
MTIDRYGADWSGTPPTVPASGYVALQTIPTNHSRREVEIQNQSASILQVVVDDGAGGNATCWLLAPAGAGLPGQSWMRISERARIIIYGPTSAQFAAREYQ